MPIPSDGSPSVTKRPVAHAVVALLLAGATSACGAGPAPSSEERAGAPLWSARDGFAVVKTTVGAGEAWSFGSVPLCAGSGTQPTLLSVEPVAVSGSIEVLGTFVRHAAWHDGSDSGAGAEMIGTMAGIPPDVRPVRAALVSNDCTDAARPITEIVSSLRKAGPEGGAMRGLTVRYRDGEGTTHSLDLDIDFIICGSGDIQECDEIVPAGPPTPA